MYSLGLDIGSSSVKAAIVDIASGKALAAVKFPDEEMKISSLKKNWAEQNPADWWNYVLEVIKKVIHESSIQAGEIKSIGISYQMHGLVCVDKNGEPVRPSIIWCDSRAIQNGDEIMSRLDESIVKNNLYNKPGNFTASKLHWVKENEPAIYETIHKVMLPGDFIAYKMCGEISSTFSGMSEGIFFDFKTHQISNDLLKAASIDDSLIPTCGNSFDVLGLTSKIFEDISGIKQNTPISYRAGDQPNNAFALGVIRDGQAAATGGTSGVVYSVSKKVNYDDQGRVNSFAHVNHTKENPSIGTLLCINGTGILYNWIRANNFDNQLNYIELENIATQCPIGSDGLVISPFGNGAERMFGNKIKGSSFHNIDFNRHTKAHIVRSGLEGIAFAFMYGMEAMSELGIDVSKIRAGNDNLFQSNIFSNTLSNISNTQITICESTGAIGAAKGAALGARFYDNIEQTTIGIEEIKTISPSTDNAQYLEAYQEWKKTII
jgi:xylulokinase